MAGLGLISDALELVNQIEDLESYQSELLLTKAALHSQIRDSKNAIKLYKQALVICEEFEKDEIYVDLAVEYENINDYSGAIHILKQGLEHNPKNEFAFSEMCYCYEKINEFEAGIEQISLLVD